MKPRAADGMLAEVTTPLKTSMMAGPLASMMDHEEGQDLKDAEHGTRRGSEFFWAQNHRPRAGLPAPKPYDTSEQFYRI